MRAEYDTEADAIGIDLVEVDRAEGGHEVHPRAIVAVVDGRAISIDLLYPGQGIKEPLLAAARAFELDFQALEAAARSALSAPDRQVSVEVAGRR